MKQQNRKKTFLVILILSSFIVFSIAFTQIYNSGKSLYSNIKLFSTILDRINRDYVEEKNPQELIDNAIKGMVSSLDPHTTYLTADQFERWSQSYEGYSGIGIYFDIISDKITIMSVIENGPSEKVGLMSGDRIVAIDGKSAIGIKRDDVRPKLMGPKGTKVEVTIERQGWSKPRNFLITRDEVHLKSIPYVFTIKPGLGYIRIVRFSSTTGDELEASLKKLESQNIKKLIIDLRANSGGYLEAAVQVTDKLLPGGKKIVYTKGRIKNSFREFFTSNKKMRTMFPIIVLIDRTSASASEIVAGALQDWDRALIVGETSFGKGLVQSQYRFNNGSALLMTTAKYYTPTGRLIQRSYNDKSSEDYISEVMVDSLRNNMKPDPSLPSFKTRILQRDVFGGGGITPDIFFSTRQDTVSQIVHKIVYSTKRPLFTFAEDYIKNHSGLKGDFNDFLRNYNPDGNCLQQFLGYIRELGFEITNEQFIQNSKDFRFYIKQTIASEIWGTEARYKVQMLRDRQLLETLDYFSQAEELLAKAYP